MKFTLVLFNLRFVEIKILVSVNPTDLLSILLLNYMYSPCIAFIQLYLLILLVKGKGKHSIQFYFIHLLYPIYLPTYFSHSYYKHLFTHYTTTIYDYNHLFLLPFNYFSYIFLSHLILILFNNLILLLLQNLYVYFFFLSELGD